MSINLFADRKMAIGFAGVIAGLAMIAGLSMGAFTPRSDDDDAAPGDVSDDRVAMIDRTAPPPSRQPSASWDGEGLPEEGQPDDWAGHGSQASPDFEPEAGATSGNDTTPEFGEYNPQAAANPAAPAGAPRMSESKTQNGPIIRSRTGPNAPALKPPIEPSGPPRLTRID